MNQLTTILIGIFIVIIVGIVGTYGVLRKDMTVPDEYDTVSPEGPPDFPISPSSVGTDEGTEDIIEGGKTPLPSSGADGSLPLGTSPTPSKGAETKKSSLPSLKDVGGVLGEKTMTVDATLSGLVTINNILLKPEKVYAGNYGVLVRRTPYYSLAYYYEDDFFAIALMDQNVWNARVEAEWDLLTTLGITPQNACKLNVSLMIPSSVNFELAGKNYRLSFCPNGTPLPSFGD